MSKFQSRILLILIAVVFSACSTNEPDPIDDPIDNPTPEPPSPDPVEPVAGELQEGERPEGDYTTSANTLFLPDSFVETVTDNNPTYGYFTTESEQLPVVGQILVYNKPSAVFPEGLMCKVTRVEAPYVYYEAVPLEEAFPRLQIDTTGIDLAGHIAYVLDGEGNPVDYVKSKSISSTSFVISIPNTTWELYSSGVNYNGMEANLKMTLNPSMTVKLGLRFQAIIEDGEVLDMNVLVDPSIHLGASINAFGELAAEKSVPLYTFYFNPVPMGPLVFVPKVTLEGYMKVDGSVGVEASISYDKGFSLGAGYYKGEWFPIFRGVETEGSGSNPATFSSKVEGGISFGLRPKLEFRLYDIIGAAVGADVSLRAGVSHKLNLENPEEYNTPLSGVSFNTSLNIKGTLEFNAKVGGTVLYEGLNMSSPEMNFTLYEAWLMPEICTSTLEIEPNPTGAVVKGMLKRNVLKKGSLYAHVFDPTDWEYAHTPDGSTRVVYKNERYVPVDWTEPKSDKDSTKFEVNLGTYSPGTTYQVDFVMSIPGSEKYTLAGNSSLFFRTFNEKQANTVAKLVAKVAEAMGWHDSPWYEVSPYEVLYMEDKGIQVSTSYESGDLLFVTLTPDPSWGFPSSIHLGSGVSSSLSGDQFWQMSRERDYTEEEVSNITSVVIDDPRFSGGIPAGKNTKRIEIHSPYYNGWVDFNDLPGLQTLDLSGTGIFSVNIGDEINVDNNPFKLTDVRLDRCPALKEVSVHWPYYHQLPNISVAECKALETISIQECCVDGAKLNITSELDSFIATACGGDLVIPDKALHANITAVYSGLSVTGSNSIVQNIVLDNAWNYETESVMPFESVTLSGLDLATQEKLKIAAKKISITKVNVPELDLDCDEMVSVVSCPSLKKLSIQTADEFPYIGLGPFTGLSGLETTYFSCYGKATSGLVPAVIDEVRERGGTVWYPQRYYYKFDKNVGEHGRFVLDSDNGYGFYYSGEPGRCYHYPKPENFDYYNN